MAFVGGDIDRPVVIGSTFNGQGQDNAQGNSVAAGSATATGNAPAWFPGSAAHQALKASLKSLRGVQGGEDAVASNQAGEIVAIDGGHGQIPVSERPDLVVSAAADIASLPLAHSVLGVGGSTMVITLALSAPSAMMPMLCCSGAINRTRSISLTRASSLSRRSTRRIQKAKRSGSKKPILTISCSSFRQLTLCRRARNLQNLYYPREVQKR